MSSIFKTCLDIDIETPFPRMNYSEAMERYGTDKPDTRFGMELHTITEIVKESEFKVFRSAVEGGGVIKSMVVKGGADISRKDIDGLTDYIGDFGAKGLAWMKMNEGELQSSIAKFFTAEIKKQLIRECSIEEGDIIFIVADTKQIANASLDALRRKTARDRGLVPEGVYNFLWVDEFPLFFYNEDEKRYESEHHPFTGIHEEDIPLLDDDPLKVRSLSYDIVLNGYELGSGSIRIHRSEIQEKVFKLLNLSEEDIRTRFGFFVDALRFGTPPHGGIAPGFDRIVMLLMGTDNIRDVIAFPKTQKASCLMTGAPGRVDPDQLRDLRLESTEDGGQ